MRYLIILLTLLLLAFGAVAISSCGGGEIAGGVGILTADFDLEGEEYLADPMTPFERLCEMFSLRTAHALSDLGWTSNDYPFNRFTGPNNAEAGLHVIVAAPDKTFIAQGTTNSVGSITFSDINAGFLLLSISGRDGNTYMVPVQVSNGTTSHAKILVFRDPDSGAVVFNAKTIHDSDANNMNDDAFSYSIFGRPRNQSTGGVVHLHIDNMTKVDSNGDGDFVDSDDRTVIEPDDDAVSSDEGDGDEDNDWIPDNVDMDIDGDGIPNVSDPDIDGDGLLNTDDTHPNGVTPKDDFNPPGVKDGLFYSGIMDIAQIDSHTVTVYFPVGIDDKNDPVTYIIYWSTGFPFDFKTAPRQRFRPIGPVSPDDTLQDNVTGLVTGLKYWFVVRAEDAAQPPNQDTNESEMSVDMEDKG